MSNRGRLCFHVPYLYPVAVGGEMGGGIEVLDWALARALARRGFDVSVATCDFGQAHVEWQDGVTLFRTFSFEAGVRRVRFFYPRLWKSIRTLYRARADVYLANGAGLPAGWAYDAARLRGARFVFLAASDKDVVRALPSLTIRTERWWYMRALRGADAHIAQTDLQRRLFRDNFGIDAHVVASPIDLPAASVDAGANNVILWLSTYKPNKRPEWFLELARRMPELQFVMIGFAPSADTNGSWRSAKLASAQLSNLEVHGFVEDVGDFLRTAALLVHTSPLEGFPNILLEAWSFGVPTLSAVDPDGVVERHRIGGVISSVDGLVEAVRDAMKAPDRRRSMGARARDYVERHHGHDRTVEPLAELLDRVIDERRSSKAANAHSGGDST
jgi:glycosyltransferase involved in cell wall biosynthesis